MWPSSTKENNTVSISNESPLGYTVTKIRALDYDSGANAKLQYAISEGNKHNVFRMDADKGTITTQHELKKLKYAEFRMLITVSDNGYPMQSATAPLNIIVNSSIPYVPPAAASFIKGDNITIAITVVGGAGMVAVFLIIAIIFVKKTECKEKNRKYNCKHAEDRRQLRREDSTNQESPPRQCHLTETKVATMVLSNGECTLSEAGPRECTMAPETNTVSESCYTLDLTLESKLHTLDEQQVWHHIFLTVTWMSYFIIKSKPEVNITISASTTLHTLPSTVERQQKIILRKCY